MAGKRYVHITQEEFDEFMSSWGFVCINEDDPGHERVYAFMWGKETYALKVYSSIVQSEGSRRVGADAIRTVLFVKTPNGYDPKWKAPRVYRTRGWRESLDQRISEGLVRGCYGRDWECKICGAPMILREGRRGFFYGCTMFPATGCSYTEDYRGSL